MRRYLLPLAAALAVAGCVDRAPLDPAGPQAAVQSGEPVVVEVKFREALRVRGEGEAVLSEVGAPLDPVTAALDRFGAWEMHRLVQAAPAELEAMALAAEARTGEAPPDLASWYQVVLPAGVDAETASAQLRALSEVEYAYPMPRPAPPPSLAALAFTTPDFSGQQGYFGTPPAGTDAAWARTLPGAAGDGVTVVDLEYDWHFAHEDLQLSPSILIAGNLYSYFGSDHGTAVLGELAARDNGFGVTGGVPNVTIRVASTVYGGTFYRPADAIAASTAATAPGDVLLLEQQTTGPNGYYVPLEWVQSVYEATRVATMAGRIVVAAAGNGGENLDAPAFLGRFDRNVRNSGAIIVGAGNSLHARYAYSCYGSRIDLQGWGGGVTTTGYGGLFGTGLGNAYTGTFSGTSSASPIVTAAVAAVQGRRKALGLPVLTAAQMADLLRTTGTPQTGSVAQNIGPFPNLRAALAGLDGPLRPATLTAAATSGTAVAVSWTPGAGHTHYRLQRRVYGADSVWTGWQNVATLPSGVTGHTDAGRPAGSRVVYQLAACDASRCSPWTGSRVVVMPVVPAPATAVTAAALSSTSIQVGWADGSSNETGFTLWRRELPPGGAWSGWAQIALSPANAVSFTDPGRTPGTTYLYRVTACNLAGCSAGAQSPAVLAPAPPAAPVGVAAAALSTTRAQVTWTDASAGETHFQVERRANTSGTWGTWLPAGTTRPNATVWADSMLASGASYLFRVRACNGPACSAWLGSRVVVMPAVPAAPTSFRATTVAASGVGLAWTDASTNETSFTLQRRTRQPDGTYGAWVPLAVVGRNATAYTDTGVAAGGRYLYRVSACEGPACSAFTPQISVAVP